MKFMSLKVYFSSEKVVHLILIRVLCIWCELNKLLNNHLCV